MEKEENEGRKRSDYEVSQSHQLLIYCGNEKLETEEIIPCPGLSVSMHARHTVIGRIVQITVRPISFRWGDVKKLQVETFDRETFTTIEVAHKDQVADSIFSSCSWNHSNGNGPLPKSQDRQRVTTDHLDICEMAIEGGESNETKSLIFWPIRSFSVSSRGETYTLRIQQKKRLGCVNSSPCVMRDHATYPSHFSWEICFYGIRPLVQMSGRSVRRVDRLSASCAW